MIELKAIYLLPGETRRVLSDWTAECEERGTTVSASAWESSNLALASPSLASNVASVLVVDVADSDTLTNTATLANGEVLKSTREIIAQ